MVLSLNPLTFSFFKFQRENSLIIDLLHFLVFIFETNDFIEVVFDTNLLRQMAILRTKGLFVVLHAARARVR